jgi:tripartite-type tricarboxylate transporter receptor subunit TctC
MNESGVQGYEFSTWYGLLVPAGTPRAIVDRLNAESRKALDSPAVKEQFTAQGVEPSPSTAQEFGGYLKDEVAKWGRVVKASGVAQE